MSARWAQNQLRWVEYRCQKDLQSGTIVDGKKLLAVCLLWGASSEGSSAFRGAPIRERRKWGDLNVPLRLLLPKSSSLDYQVKSAKVRGPPLSPPRRLLLSLMQKILQITTETTTYRHNNYSYKSISNRLKLKVQSYRCSIATAKVTRRLEGKSWEYEVID